LESFPLQKSMRMDLLHFIRQPWPWYVAGPLIGLVVPLLLILGNKSFGISSTLRHICAACFPGNIPFFQYNWKRESWNLVFVAGVLAGGVIVAVWLNDPQPVEINPTLVNELHRYGINDYQSMVPADLFNWPALLTVRGVILIIAGGFLVGFGTRYAGGCTSGHSIMGLSNLQWPSLIATCCFMLGGFITANLILPFILRL
jgi:uncharacterized membrane protein YedE/YeeE